MPAEQRRSCARRLRKGRGTISPTAAKIGAPATSPTPDVQWRAEGEEEEEGDLTTTITNTINTTPGNPIVCL